MAYDLKKPHIEGNYKERVNELEQSLYRLIEELNYILNDLEQKIEKGDNDGK